MNGQDQNGEEKEVRDPGQDPWRVFPKKKVDHFVPLILCV